MATSGEQAPCTCPTCGIIFQRQDHLKRHVLLHEGRRPFACSGCTRSFSRRDTLQRHLATHQPACARLNQPPVDETAHRRGDKACSSCRSSKQRCNGNLPCQRCAKKNLACTYLARRPRQVLKKPPSPRLVATEFTAPRRSSPAPDDDHRSHNGDPDVISLSGAASGAQLRLTDETNISSRADGVPFSSGSDAENSWQPPLLPSLDLSALAWPPDAVMAMCCSPTFTGDASLSLPDWCAPNLDLVPDALPDSGTVPPRPESTTTTVVSRRCSTPRLPASQFVVSGENPRVALAHSAFEAPGLDTENCGNVPPLSVVTHSTLTAWAQARNSQLANSPGDPLHEAILPPLELLDAFIQLYFEYFHDYLPILHRPTFNPNNESCLLVLTVAHVGSRFSKLPGASKHANSLGELVASAVEREAANMANAQRPNLSLAQATILSQTVTVFGHHRPTIEKAIVMRAAVSHFCKKIDCYGNIADPPGLVTDTGTVRQDLWTEWIECESLRRVAYASWLLDSQCCLLFDLVPTVPTELLGSQLPCHEKIWDADTAALWCEQWNKNHHASSLRRELEQLYLFNPVSKEMGALAFLLLLFGLFRDGLFLKQARDTGLTGVLNTHGNPVTYAALGLFTLWELLCPDRRTGSGCMEDVIFQTYHLVGITHHLSIDDLYSFSGFEVSKSRQRGTHARLTAWISESGDSARTVALHACRLFSHFRSKGASHGYQEPRAMLVACLSLWAYSSLTPSHLQGPFGRCPPSVSHGIVEIGRVPTRRLDRSFDEWTLVQDWIRNGCHYRGFVNGLGNIHNPNVYPLVVQQAIGVLGTFQGWCIGRLLAGELGRLADCFPGSPG